MFWELAKASVIGKRRVADAHRKHLVVDALFVAHLHDANRSHVDDGQRLNWLLSEHKHIQRIAVAAEGAGDEAVVRRVVNGAVQHTVEAQEARFLIQLVLVLAAHRYLDDGRESFGNARLVDRIVVPGMHAAIVGRACHAEAPWLA